APPDGVATRRQHPDETAVRRRLRPVHARERRALVELPRELRVPRRTRHPSLHPLTELEHEGSGAPPGHEVSMAVQLAEERERRTHRHLSDWAGRSPADTRPCGTLPS